MRRTLTLGLLAAFLLPSPAQAAFGDVGPRHDNRDAIEYVRVQGIVAGYADGSYKPDRWINRAEFTKIVVAAVATAGELATCDLGSLAYFDDVPRNAWYAPYVCVGRARGIVQGHLVSNGKPQFRAGEDINLVAASKILAVAFGIGEPPMNCDGPNGALCYEAAQRGDIWYRRHIVALEEKRAIPLTLKHFQQYVTRGEMAEMIYRLLAGVSTKPSRTYAQLENPAADPVSPPDEWPLYTNPVLGWSMRHPPETAAGSDTFAVWDGACMVGGGLGPLRFSAYTKADLDSYDAPEREQRLLPAKQRIEALHALNDGPQQYFPNKTAGPVESLIVNGMTAYRFRTTDSVDTFGGGWVTDGPTYVMVLDDGGNLYEISYAAIDEGVVSQMFSTWKDSPVRYTGKTLYDAAKACQAARAD